MTNDTSRLIFHARHGEASIDFSSLDLLLHHLDDVVKRVTEQVDKELASLSIEYRLVASPRPGSLIIEFQPQITLLAEQLKELKSHSDSSTWTDVLSAVGGFGAFIWIVCFGGNGVLDLWRRRQQPRILQNPDEQARRVSMEVTTLALRVLEMQSVIDALRSLVEAGEWTGASRAEIQVRDEPAIDIFPPPGPSPLAEPLSENDWSLRRTALPAVEIGVSEDGRLGTGFTAVDAVGRVVFVFWDLPIDIPSTDSDFRLSAKEVSRDRVGSFVSAMENWRVPYITGKFRGLEIADIFLLGSAS